MTDGLEEPQLRKLKKLIARTQARKGKGLAADLITVFKRASND